MKILISFLIIVFITSSAYAERVCIRKSDGRPLGYMSGNAPLGTLTKNAINAGFNPGDMEEKYVSPQELEQIIKNWKNNPANPIFQKNKDKKEKRKNAKKKLKNLGLTENEIKVLFE